MTLGCSNNPPKIGVLIAVDEQAHISVDTSIEMGISLAISDLDMPIEVIKRSVSCEDFEVQRAFEILIDDGVQAIIGPTCLEGLSALVPLIDQSATPVISPVLDDDLVSDMGSFVFQTSMSEQVLAKKTAELIFGEGYQRLAILSPRGLERNFVNKVHQNFILLGGEMAALGVYTQLDGDIRKAIFKIAEENPLAILFVAQNQNMIKLGLEEIRKMMPTATVFGTHHLLHSSLNTASAKEGVLLILPQSGNDDFYEKTRNAFAVPPNFILANTYDGTMALGKGFERGLEGEELAIYLKRTVFPGAHGYFNFDANGAIFRESQPAILYQVKDSDICPLSSPRNNFTSSLLCVSVFD